MKRAIDIAGSIVLIMLFLPVFVIVAITVRIHLGSPVIFKQLRPGKKMKLFSIYKFRTMKNITDEQGNLLPDAARLTRVGSLLRKMSLDELPQLFNVLKGDMSFVGPRPLVLNYIPFYTERELSRHQVRPGITGLAQISGRNCLPWNDRLEMDVYYVEKQSLMLDIKILLKTISVVLTRKGLVHDNSSESSLDEERRKQYVSEINEYQGGSAHVKNIEAS